MGVVTSLHKPTDFHYENIFLLNHKKRSPVNIFFVFFKLQVYLKQDLKQLQQNINIIGCRSKQNDSD